jgi:hypothetical protein
MSMHYFLCLGGTDMDSTKGTLGHLMSNSCVLHPVGSAGHVVNSGAPAARNINALFFMLVWDRYRFHKKHTRTHHARTCVFASGGICGSCSAFWCVQGTKHQHTIFHAQVGPVLFP